MPKRMKHFMTIQHEMFLLSVLSFLLVSLLISGVFLKLLYEVNDIFGHPLGDRLLVTVSDSLHREMRGDDILARVGGDEFFIVLPCTSKTEAEQVIRRLISSLPTDGLCGAEVSISLEYAVKSEAEQQMEDIIRAADEMMYEKKILESMEMKRKTVANIISAAEREGLVRPLNRQETQILKIFSDTLCPELCTLMFSPEDNQTVLNKRHTETGYRILSSLDTYRSVAACVLHYKEHWEGSGWPSGLAGLDIPLLSRIIAVTEGYIENGHEYLLKKSGICYDQQLTQLLNEMKQ